MRSQKYRQIFTKGQLNIIIDSITINFEYLTNRRISLNIVPYILILAHKNKN